MPLNLYWRLDKFRIKLGERRFHTLFDKTVLFRFPGRFMSILSKRQSIKKSLLENPNLVIAQNHFDYGNVCDTGFPRSHLYPLEPVGLNTPYAESFTSYITRLAHLYRVSSRALILQEILPLLKISDRLKPDNRLAWLKGSTGLNGMTTLVAEWVQVVEQLTSYNGLKFLTMLTWSNVADQSGVVRQIRAWCPNCYDEWFQAGKEIYDPLIWAIRAVEMCPRHRCSLLYRCPHQACQKVLPLLDGWYKPGFCPKCSHFLGTSTVVESRKEDREKQDWNEWVGNKVGELIAFATRIEVSPRREIIPANITVLMEQTMSVSAETLARSLGISGMKLRGWQKGLHLPQFDTLLKLCSYIDMSPLNFLTQESVNIKFSSSKSVLADYRPIIDDQELHHQLEVILNSKEHPFPSVKDIAKQLKYPAQVLEHKFPTLCNAISQKHQKQLDITYQRNFLEMVLASDKLKSLSLNEVAKLIGCNVTQLKYRFPDLCLQITQSNRKKLNLENIQTTLDEIIVSTENPPPSIKEVINRLKCSSTTLYHYFPDACHIITKKYQEWLAVQRLERGDIAPIKNNEVVFELPLNQTLVSGLLPSIGKPQLDNPSSKPLKPTNSRHHQTSVNIDEVQQALESVLASSEYPFPTVIEIAKRLKISSSALYQYFPELCHAITERTRKVVNLEDIRRKLEMVVTSGETPFPSLREISERVIYPETSLRSHFPKFCKAVVLCRKSGVANTDQIIALLVLNPDGVVANNIGSQKRKKDLDSLQIALEKLLEDPSRPSMVEVAEQLGSSTSSLYHYFPRLCRAIAERHKTSKNGMVQDLKKALEDVLLSDQRPFPTLQEIAKQLECSDKVLYHRFPDLCHAIAKRHRLDLIALQPSLYAILASSEIPPSMSEIARNLGCSVSALTYYFPEQCKAIKERLRDSKKVDEQRRVLEAIVNSEQVYLSVNEIARSLGCSNSVLYNRFPDLCRIITERRWKLSNSGKNLQVALDAALMEEPPPTMQAIARRLDCPAKNIEYYFPDLCKAIAERHRSAVDRDGRQEALKALLTSEEPMSFQEAARRLGVRSSTLRKQFPKLSFLISERYKDFRRKKGEARIQTLCDEVRQAALLLHLQGTRPNKVLIGDITGKPAKFRMWEVREAFRKIMDDLGYEL